MTMNNINELAINLIDKQVGEEEWWLDRIDSEIKIQEMNTTISKIAGIVALRNEINKIFAEMVEEDTYGE